ncbi:DUF3017 domain-containing protein [Streptomyces sp. NPDC055025]
MGAGTSTGDAARPGRDAREAPERAAAAAAALPVPEVSEPEVSEPAAPVAAARPADAKRPSVARRESTGKRNSAATRMSAETVPVADGGDTAWAAAVLDVPDTALVAPTTAVAPAAPVDEPDAAADGEAERAGTVGTAGAVKTEGAEKVDEVAESAEQVEQAEQAEEAGQADAVAPEETSQRFSAVTLDTARPEGGGRAAPGDASAPARQWPLLAVLGTTGLGLLIVGLHPFAEAFRIGTILIGLALVGGAVLRRVMPSVGMLAVRSRFTDMVTYGLLGVVIVMLSLMTQPKPWLEIPFLEDIVHSTVP